LWKLLEPQPTAKELLAKYQGTGLSMGQVSMVSSELGSTMISRPGNPSGEEAQQAAPLYS
jgi:hypothetical protein